MPTLVYHGTPRLHPEAGSSAAAGLDLGPPQWGSSASTSGGIAAIRFPRPVRLSQLRVVPAGVVHPTGVGETDPTPFTAEVFLNVAPSDPVNALARTSASVWPAPHALEFALDMPPGTTTRLVIVRAPVDKITMSLYADEDGNEGTEEDGEGGGEAEIVPSPPTPLPLPSAADLLGALPALRAADADVRRRALSTLAVLAWRKPLLHTVLSDITPLLALRPESDEAVLSILGLEADNTDAYARGLEALAHLSSLDSARAAHFPLPESQLDIALRLARTQAASAHPQAPAALSTTVRVLGALLAIVESEAEAEAEAEDEIAADAEETETTETAKLPAKLVADLLLRSLPPLAVQATARGVPTPIPISVTVAHAPTVASTLLRAALLVTVEGNACAPAAARLVRPFLPALPDGALRRAWDPELRSASAVTSPAMSAPSAIPSTVASAAASAAVSAAISTVASPAPGAPRTDAADAMALQRALASPSSSLALTPTPAALLSVLAPGLLAALATAPAPPLGIAPVLPSGTRGSASDYAGKVYSAHEFRRERDTVSGLGIGLAGVGRKASRHVDDFTR